MTAPLLETRGLNKAFGRVIAAGDITLSLRAGEITSVIGPNGAGKSTFINLLSGLLRPDAGKILFEGRDITSLPTHRRVRLGLCRSFQVVNVFPALTVFENVEIPVLALRGRARRSFRPVAAEREVRGEVEGILARVGLEAERDRPAMALSHGDQRLLEVGIALGACPRLLFLDEPTAGMNPVERTTLLESVRAMAAEGRTTFVIVEHDMDIVFALSDRVIVLHHGTVLADGTTEEIRANPRVREVYLGEGTGA